MNVKGGAFFALFLFLIGVSTAFSAGVEALIIVPFERDITRLKRHWRFIGQPLDMGERTYQKVILDGHTFLLTVTKAGLSETTLTCDIGLLRMKAKRIISIGVAGALDDKYQPGDVVVVERVTCHERGSYGADGQFVATRSKSESVTTDAFLDAIQAALLRGAETTGKQVHTDHLVSGNSFIAGSSKRESLRSAFGAGLVDMNSSGISASCAALKRPYYILRVVSDYANESAQQDFNTFCNEPAYMDEFWALFQDAFGSAIGKIK